MAETGRVPPSARFGFEKRGDAYALVREGPDGKQAEIVFTESEIMKMSPALARVQLQILEDRQSPQLSRSGLTSKRPIPVRRAELNSNAMKTFALMEFEDDFGNRYAFAIPPDICQFFAAKLPNLAADFEVTGAKQ